MIYSMVLRIRRSLLAPMPDTKPRSRVVIEELRKEISTHVSSIPIVQKDTSQVDISLFSHSRRIVDTSAADEPEFGSGPTQHVVIDTQSQKASRHSGRVIRQPDRYMFLGESFDKVPGEQDTDPCNYKEAIQDKDTEFWQKAMMSEMESMYSNQVWDLVNHSKG